jgi:hypothetical protein
MAYGELDDARSNRTGHDNCEFPQDLSEDLEQVRAAVAGLIFRSTPPTDGAAAILNAVRTTPSEIAEQCEFQKHSAANGIGRVKEIIHACYLGGFTGKGNGDPSGYVVKWGRAQLAHLRD